LVRCRPSWAWADADRVTHSHSDGNTLGDSDHFADAHGHTDRVTYGHADGHGHADRVTDGHADRDACGHTDCVTYGHADGSCARHQTRGLSLPTREPGQLPHHHHQQECSLCSSRS
jgi:hypothetical protein